MWLPWYPWWRTDPNENSTSSTSLQKAKKGRFVRVIMFDTTWILREIKGISLPKNYLFWGGAKLVLTFSIIWSIVCLENITGDLEDVFFLGQWRKKCMEKMVWWSRTLMLDIFECLRIRAWYSQQKTLCWIWKTFIQIKQLVSQNSESHERSLYERMDLSISQFDPCSALRKLNIDTLKMMGLGKCISGWKYGAI